MPITASIDSKTALDVAQRYYGALTTSAATRADLGELYAKDARFEDDMFVFNNAKGILKMWGKLSPDFQATYKILGVDGNRVSAHITADYTLNGKHIHNEIDSRLTVIDGKIQQQAEHWDYDNWVRQEFTGKLSFLATPIMRPLVTALFRNAVDFPTF